MVNGRHFQARYAMPNYRANSQNRGLSAHTSIDYEQKGTYSPSGDLETGVPRS